jgi:hypothetical protein
VGAYQECQPYTDIISQVHNLSQEIFHKFTIKITHTKTAPDVSICEHRGRQETRMVVIWKKKLDKGYRSMLT